MFFGLWINSHLPDVISRAAAEIPFGYVLCLHGGSATAEKGDSFRNA